MSRPRYWWYDYVKKAIQKNIDSTAPLNYMDWISVNAVSAAIEETKHKCRGDERLKMIDLVYRKRQCNVPGAAVHLYISEGTARDWNQEFVYSVAKKMGFL